jgi:hypothetical protein
MLLCACSCVAEVKEVALIFAAVAPLTTTVDPHTQTPPRCMLDTYGYNHHNDV